MYKRLLANEPFLRLLTRSSAKRRKVLLRQASKKELIALFEICLNIIKGNIPLNSTQFKKLEKHQRVIRTLSDKKGGIEKKDHSESKRRSCRSCDWNDSQFNITSIS